MAMGAVWQGEYYSKHSHVQERWHDVLLKSVDFRGDESILDLGCGDGRLTLRYLECAPKGEVLGIDSSESMISWAYQQYGRCPRLTFRVQDIMNFSYNGAFDLIFSSNSLHWVSDHRTVIHRIARALTPGGQFVLLFCWRDTYLRPIQQAIQETLDSSRWQRHFIGFGQTAFSYPEWDYEKWALEAKISRFSTTKIDTDDLFEDFETFVAWMKGWLQPLKRLPPHLHAMFAEEVGFRYLQYPDTQDAQGCVHFPQKLLLVKGALLSE